MGLSQKSFASNCFIYLLFFLKLLFQFRSYYKELICCTKDPNAHIRTFLNAEILFDGAFSL